jgi:hypothetical protein
MQPFLPLHEFIYLFIQPTFIKLFLYFNQLVRQYGVLIALLSFIFEANSTSAPSVGIDPRRPHMNECSMQWVVLVVDEWLKLPYY